jgi:indole-3-glycerol phosphate synthase
MGAIPATEVRRIAESSTVPALDLKSALTKHTNRIALIAEVKRASPSRGELMHGVFDPVSLAIMYQQNGASAISVLTDERFFKGSLQYLTTIKQAVRVPVLRKDFVVDPYQLYEARAAGADAVLLIVAAVDALLLKDLCELARQLSLSPLVEVHNEAETERALHIGADIIGVNNRDLHTFTTDIQATARCAALVQSSALLVSESGIFTVDDVWQVAQMGARAILVGESIITSTDPAAQVRALSSVSIQQA